MGRGQGRFDPERTAGSYFLRDVDASSQGLIASRGNFLHHAHAEGFLSAPMVARQHVAHGISPSGLTDEADRRAAAWKTTVGVLILPEPGIGRGYADVGRKEKFMAHVPCVAVNNDDQRLRQCWGHAAQRTRQY